MKNFISSVNPITLKPTGIPFDGQNAIFDGPYKNAAIYGLCQIMIEVENSFPPGAHSAQESYAKVLALCKERGITVTLDEVKREYISMEGFP